MVDVGFYLSAFILLRCEILKGNFPTLFSSMFMGLFLKSNLIQFNLFEYKERLVVLLKFLVQ